MKFIASILLVLILVSTSYSQEDLSPQLDWSVQIIDRISQLMDQQESCWNEGNLDCFMESYWQNDSLMFVGKTGVTYGWQSTLDNYKKGYPNRESMGKLHFRNIKIVALSKTSCYVIGRWELSRTIGDISGHYTLLWRLIDNQWKIVADHSS